MQNNEIFKRIQNAIQVYLNEFAALLTRRECPKTMPANERMVAEFMYIFSVSSTGYTHTLVILPFALHRNRSRFL